MGRIAADAIKIEFDIAVSKLYTLDIRAAVNDHGFLEYSGLIPEAQAKKILTNRFEREKVKVFLGGRLAFCGIPLSVVVEENNEAYRLLVKAVSSTHLLTYNEFSYFYQDAEQTYVDVLEKSLAMPDIGASLINTVGDFPIKDPILQYCWTPWSFALRMAGKITAVITPNITTDTPHICLGIPKGETHTVDSHKIVATRHIFKKTRNRDKFTDITSSGYVTHKFEDEAVFYLGDMISFGNESAQVIGLHYSFQDGVMFNTYSLGSDKYYTPNLHTNKAQVGLILNGQIIDVRGQEVKVHLMIPDDAVDGPSKATWFEYAQETSNGMYDVPPIGTGISLEWHSEQDGDIRAINSLGQWNGLEIHRHKYYITEYGKQLHMAPRRLSFVSDSNILTFERGIHFQTKKGMSLHAKEDIIIKSGKRIRIKTPEQIIASKSYADSSIVMAAREIDVKSSATTIGSEVEPSPIDKPRRRGLKKIVLEAETVAALNASTPKF